MPKKTMEQMAREFLDAVEQSTSSVALTGAGVSTGSGIPDFRSKDGLFSKISQQTFEIDFFFSSPEQYYRIAKEHIHTLADKEPNITHTMLAELEKMDLLKGVITQNIDGLHQKAGSDNVIEFHGDVTSFHCTECEKTYNRQVVDDLIATQGTPFCECGALIRPGIVFYGDPIPQFALWEAQELAATADVFVAMGTSLTVNPAATLAAIAKESGAELFIITRDYTPYHVFADHTYEVDLTEFSEAVLQLI